MASTIDPTSLAQQLAQAHTSPAQKLLTGDKQLASAKSAALTKLKSALQVFNGVMAALSDKKGVTSKSATLSDPTVATASAKPTAGPATYSFFVEKVGTAHQVAFEDLPAVPVATGGPLTVNLANGENFTVDLAAADANMDGSISQEEIGRAINLAGGNAGKVTASVVKSGLQTHLILTSTQTGVGGQITLDASAMPNGALKDEFSAAPKEMVAAQDAVLWLGNQGTGVRIQQGSNTFTDLDGVSLTVTKAMAGGAPSVTLTVGDDTAATAANMQSFVDAFNTLKKTLDELTSIDRTTGAASIFASDAGVRNLRNRLNSLVRQDFGGVRVMDFGVGTTKEGLLTLDKVKLDKAVALRGSDLNTVLGSQSLASPSGLLGELDLALDKWTDTTTGQIKTRQDAFHALDLAFTKRQEKLDKSYDLMYARYLNQFTQLQALQERMAGVGDMFENMFASKK